MNENVTQYDDPSYNDAYLTNALEDGEKDDNDSHFQKYRQVYMVLGTVGGLALAAGLGAGIVIGSKAARAAVEKKNVVLDVTDGMLYATQAQAARRLGADPSVVSHHIHGNPKSVNGHRLAKVSAVTK